MGGARSVVPGRPLPDPAGASSACGTGHRARPARRRPNRRRPPPGANLSAKAGRGGRHPAASR